MCQRDKENKRLNRKVGGKGRYLVIGGGVGKRGRRGATEEKMRKTCLTNILETDSAGCLIKVYAVDVQRVQLCYVVSSYLHKRQSSSARNRSINLEVAVCLS